MRSFSFFLALLLSLSTFAAELITDESLIVKLHERTRENSFYIGSKKVFSFDVGDAQTPYYTNGALPQYFTKKENQCFEVTIHPSSNVAARVPCTEKKAELTLADFPDFHHVDLRELVDSGAESFTVIDDARTFKLKGYTHTETIARQAGPQSPSKFFHTTVSQSVKVNVSSRALSVQQSFSIRPQNLGYFSNKIFEQTSTIELKPDTLLFSNGRGEVILYYAFVHESVRELYLLLNSEVLYNLTALEERSRQAPVCYQDNLYVPGKKDCGSMIIGAQPVITYESFQLLKLNFSSQTIELL